MTIPSVSIRWYTPQVFSSRSVDRFDERFTSCEELDNCLYCRQWIGSATTGAERIHWLPRQTLCIYSQTFSFLARSYPTVTPQLFMTYWQRIHKCNSGCSNVGPQTAMAAAKSCPLLTTVNFNYTAVTPVSLVPLVIGCSRIEVLKLAGIQNWASVLSI